MHDYKNDEIEYWKRKALGLPEPKEFVVGPDSLLTIEQITREAMAIFEKEFQNLYQSKSI